MEDASFDIDSAGAISVNEFLAFNPRFILDLYLLLDPNLTCQAVKSFFCLVWSKVAMLPTGLDEIA